MNCQEIQEKLLAHRVGELDDAAATALHQHLETCAACRAAAEETERVLDLMRSAFAAGPAAPARLDKPHRNRVLRAQFTWAGYRNIILEIAAVIVVCVVLSGLLLPATVGSIKRARLAELYIDAAPLPPNIATLAPDATAPESASRFSTLARAERGEDRKAADKAPEDTLKNLEAKGTREYDWSNRGGVRNGLRPPLVEAAPPAKPVAGNEVAFGGEKNVTINGNISGAGIITKSGSGTLTLEGANTYAGGTTLNAGTLVMNATAATDGHATGGDVAANNRLDPAAKLGISGATSYRTGGGGGEWFKGDGAVAGSGGAGGGGAPVSDLNGTAVSLGGTVVIAGKNALVAEPEGRRDTGARGEQRGNTVDLAGWAESGQKQPFQNNITVVNGEPIMPLRTELPKPMLAGTPKPIGPAQFEAYASRVENERLKEVADAPVSGLKMDTAGNSYYAWSDEAKKLSEHRKSVDELRDTSAAWAATPTTPAPDVQLGNGRVVTPPVGAVVVSGGVLSFNGGTLDAGFVNGPGAAQLLPKPPASGISSGEAFLPKAKEAKDGLRQEAQAADKSERSGHYQVMNDVLVSAASEAKPTGEKVVRGLAADDWANDAVAPAAAPVDLGFGGAATQPAFGLDMASTIKSPMILKGIAKGYGGRFGHAGLGRGGRVTDAEAETDGEHKEAASHELRAYDVRKKDLVALGDVSKLTGKDTDGDSIITAAGGGELGRFSKRERALEETEKTRRLNVLVTDTDEKAKAEDEKQSLERHATRERLAKTTIPNIDFKQANIQDVAQFISQTKSADGTDAGLKIEVDPSVAEVPPITMTLKRVNALDTVKYVSDIAGLSYHIDGDKVVITSRGVDASRVVTRAFDINSSLIESITKKTGAEQSAELQTFFTSAGMSFPQGASVAYDATKQKLIVSNTPENVEKVEGLTATLDAKVAAKPTEPVTKPIFRAAGVNPWMAVSDQSFSTFSISVDSASFTLARRYLNGGQRPPPESVRTEEFVNYLDYAYAPPGRDLFSVHAAFARTPFCPPGVQLLKLGIKGRQFGREDRGANLTFLLDNSGSMNAPDRLGLARDALKLLVAKLGPRDRVALVTFSSRARLVLDFTPATEQKKILAALDSIQAAGFTHLEAGLKLAYRTAARGFVSGASNRVILMSDGVANVGADETAELLAQVEQYRKQGLFCSVFGLGTGTYDDTMLQALASKGNGTYLFMDSLDEARRVFVDEFAATLNKIASDVKIQVEFNPRRVKQYRQLGYEQRQLKTEDFRNDAVAAGEVGSGQSVTALYQIELQGDATEPLGTVRVRGRNLETGRVEELERAITAADLAPSFERADVRFQLAAAAAQFAEILRGSPYAEGASCADVAKVLRPIALELNLDQKVQELLRLVTAAGGAPQAAE